MQTDTMGLSPEKIQVARGRYLGTPILGQYETDSGILVVKDMKKNPKIEKMKVLKLGGPFTTYEFDDKGNVKDSWPGEYCAKRGDILWMKRAHFKRLDLGNKSYIVVKNQDVVAIERGNGDLTRLVAPADFVIVETVFDGLVEGSKIITLHDRDKEYVGNFHGEVVSVGPDYKYGLKAGDKVRFRRHEGTKIDHEGKKYLSLKPDWVVAIETGS